MSDQKSTKRAKQTIYQDNDGNEIFRKDKTRGRPPANSTEMENGDVVVKGYQLDETTGEPVKIGVSTSSGIEMITLDAEGNEINRRIKPRGPANKGFVKHTEGKYAGHWVMQCNPAAIMDEEEPVEAKPLRVTQVAGRHDRTIVQVEHRETDPAMAIEEDAEEWEEVT